MATPERRWLVRWLGDSDYGRDTFQDSAASQVDTVITAVDAGTSARRAVAGWRREDDSDYGEGTAIGVQELVEPPPIRTFVVGSGGRPKLERTADALERQRGGPAS